MKVVLKAGTGAVKEIDAVKNAITAFEGELLVVPGGWRFANLVREVYGDGDLSDDAAHWMAVAAMDQTGYLLSDLLDLPTTEEPEFDDKLVLLPYRYLRMKDPLPHSWGITSDAISVYVAAEANANLVVFAKDVPGILKDPDDPGSLIREIDARELEGNWTALDPVAPRLAEEYDLELRVVYAGDPDNLLRAMCGEEFVGTRVVPG
ncbi:amino acid kinase family protein [Methanopyrus kandleri]